MTVKRKPWESLDIVGAFEATSFREMTFFLRGLVLPEAGISPLEEAR
jgi:hypothetical protein